MTVSDTLKLIKIEPRSDQRFTYKVTFEVQIS
jgi:hypothetical protein